MRPRLRVIPPAGNRIKTKRQTTGSVAGGATADVTVTWPSAFGNTNYTVPQPGIEDSANDLVVDRIVSRTASSIVVRVRNTDTLNAATGTIHAVAVPD